MRGHTRTRSLVLSALLVVALWGGIIAISGTAVADSPDCRSVDYEEAGTSADPYHVETVDELQCIEAQDMGAYYELTDDIDASGTSSWNGGSGFDPIGDSNSKFTGTFDGNGHTISGLTIDRGGTIDVGLFGRVGPGGTVRNVGLDGGTVTGDEHVGSLVGTSNGTVSQSGATVDVTGSGYRVGGLVGDSGGTVETSYATGVVTSSDGGRIGGLVGDNDGTVEASYATGDVASESASGGRVGGLVGLGRGTIVDSYATGDVATDVLYAGGLVGESYGTIEDSYATGDVTADVSAAGGLAGSSASATIRRTYATGAVSIADGDTGGLVGDVDQGVGGTTIANSYWDAGTTDQANAFGTTFGEVTTSGLVSFGSTGDTAPAPEMQGSSATSNMPALDFTSTWQTVESGDTTATADGYPLRRALDRKAQLEAQGIYTLGVLSITRNSPATQATNADSVDFAVAFPETVENVGTDDFTTSGAASGTVDSVSSASGSTITVTVASISGDGSLGLDLDAGGDITDGDGNSLATTEPSTDETYSMDTTAPGFESSASATVDEGTTGTVLDVEAGDDGTTSPDTNVDYTLGGDDAAPFSIDANTGELSLDVSQDFENPSDSNTDGAYELTVTATDDVGNSESQSVTITIGDVDETPSFTSDTSATVAESESQTTLVQDVNANVGGDADEGVSYAITAGNDDVAGDGASPFAIDSSTGEITVDDVDDIDRSARTSFSLDVTASEGTATETQTVTVTVTDDDAPTVESFSVSNPSGRDIQVSFDADERLSTRAVDISGAESATLSTGEFTESGSGPYTYTATYSATSYGTYDVALSTAADAADNDGAGGQVGTVTLESDGPSAAERTRRQDDSPPVADAGANVTVEPGELVVLDGSGSTDDTDIDRYRWDYTSDGTIEGNLARKQTTFDQPGTYTATLTVEDVAGKTDSDTVTITVRNASAANQTGNQSTTTQVSISPGQNGTAGWTATVSNASADQPVDIAVDDTDGPTDEDGQSVAVSRLQMSVNRESDFTLDVSTSDSRPDSDTDGDEGEPRDFESETGARAVGYVTVAHSVPDESIENVTFTVDVRKSRLDDQGTNPESVALYRDETDRWNRLPTSVVGETDTHYTVEATSPGLSVFSIASAAPAFEVTDAKVSTTTLEPGGTVDVTATVANRGGVAGTYTATLTANDSALGSASMAVAAGSNQSITLSSNFETAGTYALAVDGQSVGTVTVRTAQTTPVSTPATTQRPGPDTGETATVDATSSPASEPTTTGGSGAGFGIGPALAVFGLWLVALFGRYRR